jgi:glutathione S-transferase
MKIKKMALYNFNLSSASWRVRNVLAYKNLKYEYKPVDLFAHENLKPEYRKVNPNQRVPTLEITEEDGNVHHLSESVSICEFLEEQYPTPSMLPDNILKK